MKTQEEEKGWKAGLRVGGVYRSELPQTATLERNLLGVPTFVLHAKAAVSVEELRYEWSLADTKALFIFSRHREAPFPLPIHTMYLDILLAMFANNFDTSGWLRFRFSDLLRNAGKDPRCGGDSLKAAQEAIRRYFLCTAEWRYAWKGGAQSWRGPIIQSEDVWNLTRTGPQLKRNPRRSEASEGWHRIQLHPHVVESIGGSYTRVFWKEALSGKLSPAAYSVYRYFYSFNDRTAIKRSMRSIQQAFPWQGRPDRFRKWLGTQLEELHLSGFVEGYEVAKSYTVVKCAPLEDVKRWNQPSLFPS